MKLQALLLIAIVALASADEAERQSDEHSEQVLTDETKPDEENVKPVLIIDEPKPDSSETEPVIAIDPTKPYYPEITTYSPKPKPEISESGDEEVKPVLEIDEPKPDSDESNPNIDIESIKTDEEDVKPVLDVSEVKPDDSKVENVKKPSGFKWPWEYLTSLWKLIRPTKRYI